MENKLIREKTINKKGYIVRFQVWSLTGRIVLFEGKKTYEFRFNFDIDDEQQLDFIAEIVWSIYVNYNFVGKGYCVVDDEIREKLNDFDNLTTALGTLATILNKYKKEEESENEWELDY